MRRKDRYPVEWIEAEEYLGEHLGGEFSKAHLQLVQESRSFRGASQDIQEEVPFSFYSNVNKDETARPQVRSI